MILAMLWITISLVIGKRFLSNPVTTSTMESCSLGNRSSSWQTQRHTFLTKHCHNWCYCFKEDNHYMLANLCTKGGAVLYDPLQLFMNKLHTAQTGLFQPLNLPLHQQLKGNLWHKKRRPRTLQGKWHNHRDTPALSSTCFLQVRGLECRINKLNYWKAKAHRSIADSSEDIKLGQSTQGVDGLQSAAKGLMEYVTDPRTSTAAEEMASAVTPTWFLNMCVSKVNHTNIECSQPKKVNICLLHI